MNIFKFFKKPKFKIGETIICIDDREHLVEYRKEYVVIDIQKCKICGTFAYDVGIKYKIATKCCNIPLAGKNIRWAGEFRFKKKDETSEESKESIENKLNDALKEEDYIKASEYRDKLKELCK